jgi:GntR family transcriptional regulator
MAGMSTGPTDARGLQIRIADDIRAKIETGVYAPGEKLPTYDYLAEQYMCADGSVRRAVDLLKQQGLVITRQGKGLYVRERPRARRHGMQRYSRSRWEAGVPVLIAEAASQGLRADQLMRYIGEVPAPPAVAERLGTEPGAAVHARKRTTMIEDRPNQLADSYYPLDVLAAVPMLGEENTGPGGGFARLEEAGYRLAEIAEEISVRMPAGPESVSLSLPPGTPVVELIRTAYDATGRPVEVMLAVIAGDMVTFDYRFPVPD